MLNHLVCGNFNQEEHDEVLLDSPRKSKKSRNPNPYSTRGLDQFSALLADLDRKRQEIYSQARPHDISFIRFVSSKSSSKDVVPVVIKAKDRDQKHHKSEELKVRHVPSNSSQPILELPNQPKLGSDEKADKKKDLCGSMWSHPSFYLPVMLILILGLLVVFGRSVATICTCILWYVASTVKDRSSSLSRKSTVKKKRYTRGLSEKVVRPSEDNTTRKLGRQKSL